MNYSEREKQLNEFALRKVWHKICPYKAYRNTNIEELNTNVYSAINSWEYGPQGLYIMGKTAMWKTRSVYMLLNKLLYSTFSDLKKSIKGGYIQPIYSLNPRVFSHGCMSRFGDESIYTWVKSLCEVPLLFFDDLGKEKATARVVTELFNIVE